MDDIIHFSHKLREDWSEKHGGGKVTVAVIPDQAHNAVIVDRILGIENIAMESSIQDWIRTVLQAQKAKRQEA